MHAAHITQHLRPDALRSVRPQLTSHVAVLVIQRNVSNRSRLIERVPACFLWAAPMLQEILAFCHQ